MHRLVPTLLLLAACAPNNAQLLEGSYITFLADGTSLSLTKDEVPLDKYKNSYNVDCRTFDNKDDQAALQLPDALDICGPKKWPPVYESWENQGAFHVVEEDLDPWRGEAVITAEGDLQIAFHHHIPGGQDMRFVIAVDPDFAPQHCIQDTNGHAKRVPLDGDWITNWSDETLGWVQKQLDKDNNPYGNSFDMIEPYLDGGKLFFLNALSYQYNPIAPDSPSWNLPPAWEAGSAEGKFVEEDVFQRRARYGDPTVYNAVELSGSSSTGANVDPSQLFWCDLPAGADPHTASCGGASKGWSSMTDIDDTIHQIASDIHDELNLVMQPDKDQDPVYEYAPLGHSNFWREPDGLPAGLDSWGELHYNYVVFDKGSDLSVGGHADGGFELVFDASESSTRMFVKGRFTIPKIKNDHWKTVDLEHEKLIENGATLCSAASPDDADPSKYDN